MKWTFIRNVYAREYKFGQRTMLLRHYIRMGWITDRLLEGKQRGKAER